MRNLYEVLDVDKNVNGESLKKKYRDLAKQYHPDKYMNESESKRKEVEKKFMEINEAYTTLSDGEKRKEYDKKINASNNFFNEKIGEQRKNTSDYNNIYEKFSKTGVNDLFKNFFNEEKQEEKEEYELKKKTNSMFESFFSVKK